jgi:NAD(P)-dependent dehydrogenase (short-subunit alcohol dehydrogenase family)
MRRYEGQVAIVTGAGSGIGRRITERLIEEGASVVANDVRESALEGLDAEFLATAVGDVSDPATADRLTESALAFGTGRIDALFNNAAMVLYKRAQDYTVEEWLRVMDVNLNSCFFVASAVGRIMIEQRSGAILNTASGAGLAGITDNIAYVASKHGVVGLTRALAVDWGPYGVRVNALAPGFTMTRMTEQFREQSPDLYSARAAKVPLEGRAGQVDEQAAVALFLNSPEASYVSGLIAAVDGGTHALSAGYAPRQLGE